MIFLKDNLLSGLLACERLIKKSPTPIMEMVRLFCRGGGAYLWAANASAAIEYHIGHCDYEVDVCFEPEKISAAIKAIKSPTVELEINEGLTIQTGKGPLSCGAIHGSEYPKLKMLVANPQPITMVNGDELKAAIQAACKYTSVNEMLVTAGIKISCKEQIVVYGSDTHSFVRVEIPSGTATGEYIVPAEIGSYLSSLDGECELLGIGEYLAIQSGAWRLTLNLRQTGYPDARIEKIIGLSLPGWVEVEASELANALALVGSFSNEHVDLIIGDDLSVRGVDLMGKASGEQKLSAQGSPGWIRIKWDSLLWPLRQANGILRIEFSESLLRFQIKEGWTYVQALVVTI